MKNLRLFFLIMALIGVIGMNSPVQGAPPTVQGVVFWDKNGNGVRDWGEPGIPNVSVSNGKEVVKTNWGGHYQLPAYDEMIVFVTKPAGFTPPLNKNNVPQFFYIHQPNGSPSVIQKYPGLNPTGPLPQKVNFPLYKEKHGKEFKAIITGDTQVYTNREIDYLRDSLVKEAAGIEAAFVISMGDNIGDNLSLFPRFLEVMSGIGKPLWLVPGNHDANLADAPDPEHAFETWKREFGPTYYSFDYGDVHFVVLNDIVYPSPQFSSRTYHGEIWGNQMEWLANDLRLVPRHKLIVLNMHIPIVSDIDRLAPKHNVANRMELYRLLEGFKVVSLGGHTHTLTHFQPGEELPGWGQPTPIPQVIVGAGCGSWWSGDLNSDGIPMSYQRDGAPRGFMVWNFNGNKYNDQFRASGKSPEEQMHLSFQTPSWKSWFTPMSAFASQRLPRPGNPPLTLNDLPDQKRLPIADLDQTRVVANIWNSSGDSITLCDFDGKSQIKAERDFTIGDPYAQRLQSYVFRYAMGYEMFGVPISLPGTPPQPVDAWLLMKESFNVWTCPVPNHLDPGTHEVIVSTVDSHGNSYKQNMIFEVVIP